jgi:glycosyltransferase involved in cell wall biosynthesis
MTHMTSDVVEVCLETATPITPDAIVVALRQRAPTRSRYLRPPLRYLDLTTLVNAWRRAAGTIRRTGADVVFLNPCRYLQGPPVALAPIPPSLYFCDETRRVDTEPSARASRNQSTLALYGPLYAAQKGLDRIAARRASQLATNSRYTASEIKRVYQREAEVVRLGVAESLLARAGGARSGGHLLSVGTLIPHKGHDLALRAVAMAAQRRPLVIVAPRPQPHEQARLSRLADEVGVELDVQVGISDAQLSELYATAHATLYLAQREPLGLVALEAQASGCPVIVADEGGLPETIVEGVTGWKTPREASEVAIAIDLLENEDTRRRASRAAVRHARDWTWSASAARIERLLAEVRAKRPGRSAGS